MVSINIKGNNRIFEKTIRGNYFPRKKEEKT